LKHVEVKRCNKTNITKLTPVSSLEKDEEYFYNLWQQQSIHNFLSYPGDNESVNDNKQSEWLHNRLGGGVINTPM